MSGLIVLCVDRDDDLGRKAGIKGPIIGVEDNIKAATKLLEADPEESDGNTIFQAVKTFKELKKDAVAVVTITGHYSRGYKADKNIARQLEEVLKKFPETEGVFLVTDGADDDQVIPLILSKTRILAKKTVIIKQAKELEKSYYVLKQLLHEPAFARIVFGLPGIILLTIAFLQELGMKIILLAIGLYLLLKGFGLEEPLINAFRNFKETTSIERANFPLYIAAVLTFSLSLMAGYEKAIELADQSFLKQTAGFIAGMIPLFGLSVILTLLGRIGDMHYRKDYYKIRKYLVAIVNVIAVLIVIAKAIDFIFGIILLDMLLFWIIIAFLISAIGSNLMKKLYYKKYVKPLLRKELEVFDSEGNFIGKIKTIKDDKVTVKTKQKEISLPAQRIVLVAEDFASLNIKKSALKQENT